ncbi:MAG TPA: ATP-binding protein [Thermotogota bacterium]|nr:ATP-binding protein [Thermotogota bacterium]HRW34090.1 ATP-binding protein [Thermotogota bacterium]
MADTFVFTFSSKIDNIRVIRSSLRTFLKLKHISDAEIFDTELAINEALANIIEHTYQYTQEEIIILRIFWDDEQRTCLFEIQDEGKPVDVNKIGSRDLDDLKDHGLGVYLMKNIMNEIEYRPIENGNILFMKKKFSDEGK